MPITESGVYRIDVLQPSNNPTHLSDGVYDVTVEASEVDFRRAIHANAWGWAPGTFDRVSMMNIFDKQGRVLCTLLRPESENN
jgi:hypothetical protein